MENQQTNEKKTTIVIKKEKSVGLAILLTILFGPLGMLYSTISGAIIMLIISVIIAFLTFGYGVLITWPICIIWGALAARSKKETKTIEIDH